MADRYADLPVVGHGRPHRTTAARRVWLDRLNALAVGDAVDVLLDDGRIVRTAIRVAGATSIGRPETAMVWLRGISGGYAAGRVRTAGGWWGEPGVTQVPEVAGG